MCVAWYDSFTMEGWVGIGLLGFLGYDSFSLFAMVCMVSLRLPLGFRAFRDGVGVED